MSIVIAIFAAYVSLAFISTYMYTYYITPKVVCCSARNDMYVTCLAKETRGDFHL